MTKTAFKLQKLENCFLQVNGKELKKGLYDTVEPSIEAPDEDKLNFLSYKNTATLNILVKLGSDKTGIIVESAVCEHNFEDETPLEDFTIHRFSEDGLFKVIRVILHTLPYLRTIYEPDPVTGKDDFSGIPEITFAYDDGKIYQITPLKEEAEELDCLDQFLTLTDIHYMVTNLDADPADPWEKPYVFNLCNLQKCFYKHVNDILKKMCSDKCSKEDTATRDLIWMALNAIQYLLDNGQFYEAQCLLERITSCNGVCKDATKSKVSNDCGCHG